MWLNPEITVWLYKERVDMRKSIDGLSIIVASQMSKNPSSGEIFLFFNKSSIMAHLLVNKTNPYTNEYLDEKILEQYNSDIENVKKNKDIIHRYNDYIASKNM